MEGLPLRGGAQLAIDNDGVCVAPRWQANAMGLHLQLYGGGRRQRTPNSLDLEEGPSLLSSGLRWEDDGLTRRGRSSASLPELVPDASVPRMRRRAEAVASSPLEMLVAMVGPLQRMRWKATPRYAGLVVWGFGQGTRGALSQF